MSGIGDDGEPLEHDIDALLDMSPPARVAALERLAIEQPNKAEALGRWLRAIDASEGFLEHGDPRETRNRIGQRIGRWRVVAQLGEGGFAEVFLVERDDRVYQQKGALKLLRRGPSVEDWQIAHERQLLARLDHPNIARLLDGGVTPEGQSFLVTEHIQGQTLSFWRADSQPSLRRRISVLLQIAEAVGAAHSQLVVHGDLKPDNLLVDADDRVRLIDFGVSRLIGGLANNQSEARALTPAWAAPEQLAGGPATPQSDVYTLGLLLYWMLIGHLPPARRGESRIEMEEATRTAAPPQPSKDPEAGSNARLARGDLDGITTRCLQTDPAARYQDVRSLIVDLRAWQQHEPISARPWTRRYLIERLIARHPLATALVTLLCLAVLALAADNLRLRSELSRMLRHEPDQVHASDRVE